MKLQNNQTGQVENFCIDKDQICSCDRAFVYDSLTQLQEAGWEDYGPLIKEDKIRKAVRAWAEANDVPSNVQLAVFEYLGTGLTAIRYTYKAETKPYERSVKFEYISSDKVYGSQNDREHTIEELCGGEE